MTITHPQPRQRSAAPWSKEIESLLSAREDPTHPDFGETQRLLDLVFGCDPQDSHGGARLTPAERDAAIAYYLELSRRAAARDR